MQGPDRATNVVDAMNVPDELRYTKDHEWVRVEGARVTVGITDYAQDALGDVVFVQVPEVGSEVRRRQLQRSRVDQVGFRHLRPLSGTVVDVNADLADQPQRLNDDPYGEGWIFVMEVTDQAQLRELLDADSYRALIEG